MVREALLAVLSILIWHFYNVLIKYRNFSIFTGWLPRDQMEEEHAIELERIEAGGTPWPGLALPVLYNADEESLLSAVLSLAR